MKNYKWGPTDKEMQNLLIDEILNNKIYTKFYDIKENDIVVDIGASTGIFTYSILDKKPKHVFCFEPSKTEFPHLVTNTIGYPVTHINKAITSGDGFTTENIGVYYDNNMFETMKFRTFLNLYNINKINFLKLDCEGGEYHVFTDENINFLLNNVDHIVGEWHLSTNFLKYSFRNFRDKYINMFKNVQILSIDGIDIKWDLWNDHFIDYYNEIIIHISNI